MLARPLLILSSYAPLFALLALRFEDCWLVVTCAVLAGVGALSLLGVLVAQRRVNPGNHKLTKVRDAGAGAAAYLATYLLPFLTIDSPGVRDAVAYGIFLAVVAAVHWNSSVLQVNPLLFLVGYRVLAVEDEMGFSGYLVTNRSVSRGETVSATIWSSDILIQTRST